MTSYNFLYPKPVIFSPKLLQLLISDSSLSSLPNSYNFLYPTAHYLLSQTPTSDKHSSPLSLYLRTSLLCIVYKIIQPDKKKTPPKSVKIRLTSDIVPFAYAVFSCRPMASCYKKIFSLRRVFLLLVNKSIPKII